MEKLQSTSLMLQSYFDELLVLKLVESGAISIDAAREIAVSTAEFAHEIADDKDRIAAALACAAGFERIAASLAR